jgi:hypothetical protein
MTQGVLDQLTVSMRGVVHRSEPAQGLQACNGKLEARPVSDGLADGLKWGLVRSFAEASYRREK